MNGFTTRFLPALALLSAALLPLTPGSDAAAQGFSSVSSPSTVAAAAPGAAAHRSGTVESTSAAAVQPSAPAAQLASLNGFNSGSGAVPGLPGASPETMRGRGAGSTSAFEQADKVLVDKSDRKLYLLRHDRVVAEYPVKLGLNPYGHKQQEGDFRTPEGKYTLSRRNPRSEFFLAIQVSYPNREDAAWAKENGWSPGGLIMIHGQPNVPKRPADFYANRDWTDGCIALSNADMVDVWLRTSLGIPIEIRP
ncbi:MAG TPA: L,D-transpeptidase family protein [Steroidobacteraceae bacterium]|nr:L,D-transpeptidase family protein [Steroidobacteraceae bacterium]